MDITQDALQTICLRGDNLVRKSKLDTILYLCLLAAIDGFDFETYEYEEGSRDELEDVAEQLRSVGFAVDFDGDKGHEYMSISWY